MEQLKPYFEPLERLLEIGGTKKDIACIVISAISLVLSFMLGSTLPFDPAWIAIILCGLPIVIEAIIALVTEFDIKADVLVSLALVASIAVGEYFAAGEVATIMQLGGLLEELTVVRAQKGIQRLVELTPRTARLILPDGTEQEIAADAVELNQLVRVLPGEVIPVDGVVTKGNTSVDESVVTGESMPADKQEGSEVSAGTINQFGAIEVKALRVGEDSSIARMARLVQSADAGKARIVSMADRWATWVVVGALTGAIAVYLVTGEILRAVTVLVVFCPCSLVLATPTAIVAAIGNATKHGFLVKEGDALERLAQVDKVAFDKTGTLTKGEPRVFEVGTLPAAGAAPTASTMPAGGTLPAAGLDKTQLFGLVASAEAQSEHPLGKAIVATARSEGIELTEATAFEMVPGQGVKATIGEVQIAVGNEHMMSELALSMDAWDSEALARLHAEGCTITYVCVDGVPAGYVALCDTVREESRETVSALRNLGVSVVLLTGDNAEAAQAVAHKVGAREVIAQCRPEDKMCYIEGQENSNKRLAMIGDGVNDAPALKRAFVGVAVGGVGSDIAVEAADIVIVDNTISEMPHLVALSKHMMQVIKVNLTFSMTLNFVAIILAFMAVLDPVSGALVHNCGSVFVIICSALLLSWKQKR